MNAPKQQEFSFNIVPKTNPKTRRGRIARAKWWFAQMRAAVEKA